jgi:Zn-dependent metalloprotease
VKRVISILAFAAACQPQMLAPSDLQDVTGRGLFAEDSEAARALAERLAYDHIDERSTRMLDGIVDLATRRVQIREGRAHVRIDQTIDGIEVWGAQSIVHLTDDGAVEDVTDNWLRGVLVDTRPKLDRYEAMDIVAAREGEPTEEPTSKLFVLRHKGEDRLVWRIRNPRLDGTERSSIPMVFVDAHSGKVVMRYDDLQTASTASATTPYNGAVTFPVETEGGRWHLRSNDDGVGTYDLRNGQSSWISSSNLTDITSSSLTGFTDKTAIDAHYGAVQTVSYYASMHNRNGIDGNGGPNLHDGVTVSAVHYGTGYVNAFWNGSAMVYGDGDGWQSGPLVALDIAAHEMTHGVTEHTAGLVYQGESGALNEAMSDIFAALVEQYVKGSGSNRWKVGEDAWTPGTPNDALRYMNNPTIDGTSRDHYSTRYVGSLDNGGVHWNSGIANLAFYLLVEGGRHPKANLSIVQVPGIGYDKAGDIFYKALTEYMTPTTDFFGARAGTIQAARSLYGIGSPEEVAVAAAWAEVGVGQPITSGGSSSGGTTSGSTTPVSSLNKTNQSAATGAAIDYVIAVPEGATNLQVRITGGTGDADLYLNLGSKGTDADFDCRPYQTGNEELCTAAAPAAGNWYITVKAYSAFAGLNLTASYDAPVVKPPASGSIDEAVSGTKGDEDRWTLEVAPGAKELKVILAGGTGDADLYVNAGATVGQNDWDCRPYATGNEEVCTLANPAPGTWSVMLHAWATYSGARLTASVAH